MDTRPRHTRPRRKRDVRTVFPVKKAPMGREMQEVRYEAVLHDRG